MAAVVRQHASQGTLFVRPIHKEHLSEIQGVTLTSLQNGQGLTWNSSTSQWVNTTLFSESDLSTYLTSNDYTTKAQAEADAVALAIALG
jgi:uncharacterized phage-like protein YoqJ